MDLKPLTGLLHQFPRKNCHHPGAPLRSRNGHYSRRFLVGQGPFVGFESCRYKVEHSVHDLQTEDGISEKLV